ncbi:hypothetical protein L211DRAFT_842261 [Terfezia boudieri ATCC MYA-4762]|uniref:Uncharacterized protein n=1 Tax=Terfezia boudieri ATCC MYA-4762 TaxID=1051890 RepID=A0A3N4LAB2_9PEZI|nr:hypothetical protein L211DRAFT_842261 [Terfezia boudieri ATCC MYA-4762]
MTSTVDPTRAITEEEPFAMAQAKPTESRSVARYKDVYGNPIVEPDLSNPTRSRWERPLETIRSFEAQINKDMRRQSAFVVVDQIDNMDQTQKQVQHTSGPFDPSLYHRNNGAQRYAPVDAYTRNPQGSGYYHHGGNSQDSFDRHGGPYSSRHQSLRSNGHPPVEQIPPISHINSYGRPGQDAGSTRYSDPRRHPSGDYQRRGSPGNWQESYNYNSDPNSESSSFGSNNPNDFDVQFGDAPLQLGFSSQLEGHYTNGSAQAGTVFPNASGYANNNGYTGLGQDQSRNPYRNGEMSPNNPYNNLNNNNGGYAGTDEYNGNPTSPSGSSGPHSPGSVQKKAVPPPPPPPQAAASAQFTPPAAPIIAPPEPKKKKGLLKRLSKS